MDPAVIERLLGKLCCATESSVQCFDTREKQSRYTVLKEEGLLKKIQELKNIITPEQRSKATQPGNKPAFILITANGDPLYEDLKLEMSSKALRQLIDTGIFPPQTLIVYRESQSHFSYRVAYDDDYITPTAVHIFLRLPRIGKIINLTMTVLLPTFTTIALLTSRTPAAIREIRTRCITQSSLLQTHPLHLLNFVFERRMADFEEWVDGLWGYVGSLERKTGIGRRWSAEGGGVKGRPKLGEEEYTGLLQDLHGAGIESRLALGTLGFAFTLGSEFREVMERMEEVRLETGGETIQKGVRKAWEDQVKFNEMIVGMTRGKFSELCDRVTAQINVTYSLIAQKSSGQTLQIAQITAKDSQTMKTITVLTLTFLPSTMLASLWDAGIFTLEPDKSWRVYVGATSALTIGVFALWYLYLWVSRVRTPLIEDRVNEQNDKEKEKYVV